MINVETMTRNGLACNGPQLIVQPPSLLAKLPTAGPQYEVCYSDDNMPVLSCDEVKHNGLSTLHEEPNNTVNVKLPKRSCVVMGNTHFVLDSNLLSHPHMDHYFVKERREVKPGCFLAKLVLHHYDITRYVVV